ncbi:MAG TPA: DegV family protein [Anaerolineaceae bacterium]|nr:DegV family protein [Anaerolineaceae bacterium]
MNNESLIISRIFTSLQSGIAALKKDEGLLNRINVFPVADADTGTNMLLTAEGLIADVDTSSLTSFLDNLSSKALLSARGNSGTILASFVTGLIEHIKMTDFQNFSIHALSESVNHGTEKAYSAVANPKEGTMLSVMRGWGEGLRDLSKQQSDVVDTLEKSLDSAKGSLLATTQQMEILKSKNLLDAGALAFYRYIEGIVQTIGHSHRKNDAAFENLIPKEMMNYHAETQLDEVPSYRYCTEGVIQACEQNPSCLESVRTIVNAHGDSQVVSDAGQMIKFHVHTDTPWEVFEQVSTLGKLVSQKTDDMLRQYNLEHSAGGPLAILADSGSDLPQELIDSLGIDVVPLNIVIGGHSYLDRIELSTKQFFALDGKKSTAQPSVGVVKLRLEALLQKYEKILIISLASALSGTYQSYQQAITLLHAEDRVLLVDSKQNSVALGLLVLNAARAMAAGEPVDKVKAEAEEQADKAHIYVALDKLETMVKSGRVKPNVGQLLEFVSAKPVVTLDEKGGGDLAMIGFGRKHQFNKLMKRIENDHKQRNIKQYALIYTDNEKVIGPYLNRVRELTGLEPEFIKQSSPIYALMAGHDALAIGYVMEN